MEEVNKGLSLVLLGKTGVGKSATGNTILGRRAFKSEKSGSSVTTDVLEESGMVCGFPVSVYDTPGLYDTKLKEQEIQQKYQSVFQKCDSELCAFFLVIKVDRFTAEERRTVEKIEKMLGQNRLEKTWILFTRGDELEDEKKTLKQFISETEELKKLVQKYDQRYHLFNNKKKGCGQVKDLLIKILKTCLKKMANGALQMKNVVKKPKPRQTPVSSVPPRRIVLVGKSGVGKSAVGNTILGQREFTSKRSMRSVTSECSEAQATVSGRSVSVVDTPGLFDTQMKPEELMMEIAKSVYISSPGPHAFLIVFRIDERFTEHEKQIPQMIELLFGAEVLKYSIILFTHGDLLDGESVENLIKESEALRSLVDQCGGRYHVFNNRDVNNREQVEDLLQKIDSMIQQNGGGHYTNQMYEDAQRFKREEEEERQREEEERKQQEEKQRQEDIERVKKEAEEKVRAEYEGQLKKGDEKQKQEEIEKAKKEAEERVRAEYKTQTEQQNKPNRYERFKLFFTKYKKHFFIALGVCVVIGAGVGVGAVVGGAVGAGVGVGAAVGGVVGAGVAVVAAAVSLFSSGEVGGGADGADNNGSAATSVDGNPADPLLNSAG